MRNKLIAVFTAFALMIPVSSYADFARVCRGGALPKYDNSVKNAVKEHLKGQGIAFRRVNVNFINAKRPRDRYVDDFTPDFVLEGQVNPSVRFTGAFPELSPCVIEAYMRIAVTYPDGAKSITVTPVQIPGTMLPVLNNQIKDSIPEN